MVFLTYFQFTWDLFLSRNISDHEAVELAFLLSILNEVWQKGAVTLFVGSHNYEMFDNPNSPRFHIEKEFVFLYGRVSYVEVGLMDRG